MVKLPEVKGVRGIPLEEAIEKRRSRRRYKGGSLSLEELSRLLFYSYGITGERGFRASPSAGALYAIDVYVAVNNVDGLKEGIYLYMPEEHSLDVRREGRFGIEMTESALGQRMLRDAQVVIALVAVPERMEWRYGERTTRYITLEAGHIAQNIYLEATSLGLGACAIGAFDDESMSRIFEGRPVIYLVTVGKV